MGELLRRGGDIAERLVVLAAAVVRLVGALPRDVAGKHIGTQIVRSATSAGANYEEARAAESRADFVHKIRIAAKEMRETIFWLDLVHRSVAPAAFDPLPPLLTEANELAAILIASTKTARAQK